MGEILQQLLDNQKIREHLVMESIFNYGRRPIKMSGETNERLAEKLMAMDSETLAHVLIEGYENPQWKGVYDNRYLLEPLLRKQGLFEGKDTTLITIDNGKISYSQEKDILSGLHHLKWDIEPILGGGNDPWVQLREQWHSGANFFSLGENKVLGYRRNAQTIEALDKAGFAVLQAPDIVKGKTDMDAYDKFVAVFPASELPRAGGGARCMTMPIWRDLP